MARLLAEQLTRQGVDMAKKVVLTLVVIFLVFFLISQPVQAADGARTILDGVGSAFQALVTFFTRLAG